MASTWGDIIARGYSAGRALGDDFSQLRFNRRADKLRSEYEQRASAEGKDLSEYLPEIESRLRDLSTSVGASRRGLSSADDAYSQISALAQRGTQRRAGALALKGEQASARDTLARGAYSAGDFDMGQTQQIAGDTIRSTTGALRPDGTYDMAKGAQSLAGTAARYGDANMANAQQQGATTFRLQAAVAKADQMFRMVQNLGQFSPDMVAGVWEGLKQNVPELEGIDVRKGEDNVLYIYNRGKASGSIDPRNPQDIQELASILNQFTQAPGETLGQYMQTTLQNIAAQKERGNKISDDYRSARIDAAKNLVEKGVPDSVASALLRTQQTVSNGTNGWQLQDIGAEPGTYVMQKNGQVYVIKTNVEPNLETGEVGGTLQVFDTEGNPVPGTVLNRSEQQTMASALTELAMAQQQANYQLRAGSIGDTLSLLNEMEAQDLEREGIGVRRQPGGRGNIDIKETRDYVRKITANAGEVTGSNREKAMQLLPHLIKQESGGRDDAVSPKGARGRTQVMPATGKDPGFGVTPMRNESPEEYERFAVDYLTAMLDRYGGDVEAALAAYNAGPQRADRWFGAGGDQSPATPQRASGTAVARAGDAPTAPAAAAAAPASQAPSRRAAISADTLRGAATDAATAAAQLREARARLQAFDQEQGTEVGPGMPIVEGRLRRQGLTQALNLTPTQRRVRAQLVDDVRRAEDAARQNALTAQDLARTSRTLQDSTRQEREAGELYAKYGGAADFFSRAGGSR